MFKKSFGVTIMLHYIIIVKFDLNNVQKNVILSPLKSHL
jgi:hypothetical protein